MSKLSRMVDKIITPMEKKGESPTKQWQAVLKAWRIPPGESIGLLSCTQREAINETYRRVALNKRRKKRKENKQFIGKKGELYCRIIRTKEITYNNRKYEKSFHATRGERVTRLPTAGIND